MAALERSGGSAPCPNCGGALGAEAILCTGCGYNLQTGQQIATKVVRAEGGSGAESGNPYGGRPGRGTDRAPRSARFTGFATWLLIFGTGAWVLPLFGYQWAKLQSLGEYAPILGAVLCAIAALLYFADGKYGLSVLGGGGMIGAIIMFATVGQNLAEKSREDSQYDAAAVSKRLEDDARAIEERLKSQNRLPSVVPPPAVANSGGGQAVSPPPPPPLSDFYRDGKPKIEIIMPTGGSMFSEAQIKPMAVPVGEDPVLFFKPGLREPDPRRREVTIRVLANLPTDKQSAAAAAIAEVIGDTDVSVRQAAVRAQAIARHDGTVSTLVRALADNDSAVQDIAIRVLSRTPAEEAVDPLVQLFPRHPAAVKQTLLAMGAAYRPRIAQAFATLAERKDQPERRQTFDEIWSSYRELSGPALVHFVDDSDQAMRTEALAHLMELKYEPAAERIASRLGTDGPAVIEALTRLGAAGEKAALARLAGGGDGPARAAALRVLTAVGTKENCLAPAKTAANDDDLAVAKAARELWRKFEPAALSAVDEAVMDLTSSKADRQLDALTALVAIKPDQTNVALPKRLYELATEGADAKVQAAARKALVTWANAEVRDAVLTSISPAVSDAQRKSAMVLAVELREMRAVSLLCECVGQNLSAIEAAEALKQFGAAGEELLLKLLNTTNQEAVAIRVCDILQTVGTRKSAPVLATTALNARTKYPALCEAAKAARAIVEKRVGMR